MLNPVKTHFTTILGLFSTLGTVLALVFNRLFLSNQNIFDFVSMAISFFIIPLIVYFDRIGWRQKIFWVWRVVNNDTRFERELGRYN